MNCKCFIKYIEEPFVINGNTYTKIKIISMKGTEICYDLSDFKGSKIYNYIDNIVVRVSKLAQQQLIEAWNCSKNDETFKDYITSISVPSINRTIN